MIIDQNKISKIAQLASPFYFYDMELLKQTLEEVVSQANKYNYHVHYAFKANVDERVLSLIQSFGLGADCVSGGEIQMALENNFAAHQIVFAGVGKSDAEIKTALDADIAYFNCESVQEIEVINEIAIAQNKKARIALRINPNIDAKTHKHIATGTEKTKFGIFMGNLQEAIDTVHISEALSLVGLHFHIGSQILDLSTYVDLCERINSIQSELEKQGISVPIINVGGGLGVDYLNPEANPIADFKSYFEIFHQHLKLRPDQELHFELGRSITASCGTLISKVLYVKESAGTKFLILDAGMSSFMRPLLYDAYHKISNLSTDEIDSESYTIVGPICESSDTFAEDRQLPISKRGDLIAIYSAGAYGEVMASNYNLKELYPAQYSDTL